MKKGDGATVDPALTSILGRKPLDGVEVVKKLLTETSTTIGSKIMTNSLELQI